MIQCLEKAPVSVTPQVVSIRCTRVWPFSSRRRRAAAAHHDHLRSSALSTIARSRILPRSGAKRPGACCAYCTRAAFGPLLQSLLSRPCPRAAPVRHIGLSTAAVVQSRRRGDARRSLHARHRRFAFESGHPCPLQAPARPSQIEDERLGRGNAQAGTHLLWGPQEPTALPAARCINHLTAETVSTA